MSLGQVSIVTPTYNCGSYIEETIRSIQAQTYKDWELIIVDDCSTDNTRQVVESFQKNDDRIKYYCLEYNSGAAVARNLALNLARGRWIAFLDSDDLWSPFKLERQIQFMLNNNYHFSCTERIVIDENSRPTGKYLSGPGKVSRFGMLCYCWIGCLTVMYDRQHIGTIQIKNISKNNDYAIWLKVSRKANCYLLRENLGSYRIRKGSISNHSAFKLIKWHYRLFREAEGYGCFKSGVITVINLICGCFKKIFFVKNYHEDNRKKI